MGSPECYDNLMCLGIRGVAAERCKSSVKLVETIFEDLLIRRLVSLVRQAKPLPSRSNSELVFMVQCFKVIM